MVLNPETYAGAYIIHGGLVGNASGGAGAVRATLAYLVRGFSDAMALLSAVIAVVAVCDLLAASLVVAPLAIVAGVIVLGAFVIAGVLALGDCFRITEQYVEYMNTGDEELLKQMEAETAKALALDAVFFAAGKVVKYLANKYQLKIWEKWSAEGGICSGFTVTEMKNLKNAVIQEGQHLKDIGYDGKQLGPAIAGAYDQTTGKIYTAINNFDGNPPSALHSFLSERINHMPDNVKNPFLQYTKGVGSHAEIYAVNELLLDNPSADISKIMVYVNRTLGTSKPVTEIPFETCPHCRYILEGLTIISNVQ